MTSHPSDPPTPRAFWWEVGQVCAAGQHAACGLVGDPYEDHHGLGEGTVWSCACDCHQHGGPDAD